MDGSVLTQPPREQFTTLTKLEVEVARRQRIRTRWPLKGPRPLAAMVLTAISSNRAALRPEHIASLSDKQRRALFKTLTNHRDLTLAQWKLFLPYWNIPDATRPVHHHCTHHRQPGSSLEAHLSVLRAPPFEYTAHVRITARLHAKFGVPELVKLASLPHLGILEVIEHAISRPSTSGGLDDTALDANQVSDRLVKGWSLTRPNPFPALRVLRLWGCDAGMLTQACLHNAAEFPRLSHFEVSVVDAGHRPGLLRTWSKVTGTAAATGWIGFSQAQQLPYGSIQDNTAKGNSSAIVTLHKVEAQSVIIDALHWASHLYTFLEDFGYDANSTEMELLGQATAAGETAKNQPQKSFALVDLGSDCVDGAHKRTLKPDRAYLFVRTTEALTARANVKARRAIVPEASSDSGGHLESRCSDNRTLHSRPVKRRKGGKSINDLLDDFAA